MYKDFEPVIGLEIHAQLKTNSKLFCSDSTLFDSSDNENISVVSVGMPGALPVLNQKAIDLAIKAGLALGCEIRKKSRFSRKNYFYPDLPKGYQISQYDEPLCENGEIVILINGAEKKIKIQRAHLEEDAGKSTHFGEYTLVNYNRAGIPLLEIVSAPVLSSSVEAAEYARTVRQILQYIDACDGNLEEGSLRCDCNVSVRKKGDPKLGIKVEIKNLNSFRFIEKAIDYEIERQIECLERNEKIFQETRLYDPDKNKTVSMRSKEDAQDYRYFPDPDLLPLIILDEEIIKHKKELPALPQELRQKFVTQYLLPENDVQILISEKEIADYFIKVAEQSGQAKLSANWIITEVIGWLNENNMDIRNFPIQPLDLAELLELISSGSISGRIAKNIFADMCVTKKKAKDIVDEKNLRQISDVGQISKIIDEVILENPQQVKDYKDGKQKVIGFFVGLIMKKSKGQAQPDLINKILIDKLKEQK